MKNHKDEKHLNDDVTTPKNEHKNGYMPNKNVEQDKDGMQPKKHTEQDKNKQHNGEKSRYFGEQNYKKTSCNDENCTCKGNDCNNDSCNCNCHCKA